MNKLIEDSHKQYLTYEEKIAAIELKEKQTRNKLQSLENDNLELLSKMRSK